MTNLRENAEKVHLSFAHLMTEQPLEWGTVDADSIATWEVVGRSLILTGDPLVKLVQTAGLERYFNDALQQDSQASELRVEIREYGLEIVVYERETVPNSGLPGFGFVAELNQGDNYEPRKKYEKGVNVPPDELLAQILASLLRSISYSDE